MRVCFFLLQFVYPNCVNETICDRARRFASVWCVRACERETCLNSASLSALLPSHREQTHTHTPINGVICQIPPFANWTATGRSFLCSVHSHTTRPTHKYNESIDTDFANIYVWMQTDSGSHTLTQTNWWKHKRRRCVAIRWEEAPKPQTKVFIIIIHKI